MLTELDQIANQNHLQLIKALIPYLPASRQKTISVLIKLLEMRNVLQYYSANAGKLRSCETPEASPQDPLDILSNIRSHCDGPEQELIDQILQAISMIELYSMVAQQEGGDLPHE